MTRLTTILTIAALLTATAIASAQVATVSVRAESKVSGGSLTLGDIAEVSSSDAGLTAALRGIRLGVSPLPGSWRELDRDMILHQIRRNGFGSGRVALKSPAVARIFRASQRVTEAQLSERLRSYIVANAPWQPGEMDIREISRVGEVLLPDGPLTIDIRPRGGATWLGMTPFVVDMQVDGVSARQIVMQARIAVMRSAVVAVKPIPVRQSISVADVEVRRIDISTAGSQPLDTVEQVVGMEAASYIQPGQMITGTMLRRPLLVKRGQAISLEAVRPGFVIHTSGVAQADGRLGDVIRVTNPASKKTVEAKVTGAGRAEVIF